LRAPLIASHESRRELVTLSGAARYDDYSDFGNKVTWQTGIEYRPIESLLLRATRGTAFKPPTLFNLASPLSTGSSPVTDPRHGRAPTVVQATSGGNPNLEPTTADTSTVGIAWSPRAIQNLNLSLTGWRLHIDKTITLPS